MPTLPPQSSRAVDEMTLLVVTNTASVSGVTVQWLTNTFVFSYSNRVALLADGWSFLAKRVDMTDRDTEVTNLAVGGVVDFEQSAHPGALRLPCDVGDLWTTHNNSRNSLFHSLPSNWFRVQLAIAFAPVDLYQQAHLALYVNDDNYLQVGVAFNGSRIVAIDSESGGAASTPASVATSATNFLFRFERSLGANSVTASYSGDGVAWLTLGTVGVALANPNLAVWTGGSQAGYSASSPVCDLQRLEIVVSNIVPTVLTYQLAGAPAGTAISPSGVITWTPTEEQGPSTNILTTVVQDNGLPPLSATNSFSVVVNEVNRSPTLPALPNLLVTNLVQIVVTNSAADPDLPANPLSYGFLSAPTNASIDAAGVIRWTPTAGQAWSTNTFTTVVTDYNPQAMNAQLSATNSFNVVLAIGPDITGTNEVQFCDANLEAVVRAALLKSVGTITWGDMQSLKALSACERQITNLCGLEWANNLTALSLSGNGISDISPLANLRQVQTLALENNPVATLAPLANLHNLKCLSLGSSPTDDYSALSGLTNLVSLSIRNSKLRNLTPFQPLAELRSLTVWESLLTDLSSLAGMTNLNTLDLRWNLITNSAFSWSGMANLASLYLGGNPIKTVPMLQSATQLSLLNLDDTRIGNISPLSGLTNLSYLSLNRVPMTNLAVLSSLTGLTTLELRGNTISNANLFAALSRLEFVDLSYNSLSDISPLTGLSNLHNLVLTGNPVSTHSPLSQMHSLSNLWLAENRLADVSAVTGLSWLNYLDLENNAIEHIEGLFALTNLTGLALSRNPISDCSPLGSLTGLTSLRLEHVHTNAASPPSGLRDLAVLSNLPQLSFLSLNQNYIRDLTPMMALTNLQSLYLRRNALTDVSVLTNLLRLRTVDISLNYLDVDRPDSEATNVVAHLRTHNVEANPGTGGWDPNLSPTVQFQGIAVSFLPTNQPPQISIPLPTGYWPVPNNINGYSSSLYVSERNVSEAEWGATALVTPEKPWLLALENSRLPGTNGHFVLAISTGYDPNKDTNATLLITVQDDVGNSSTASVPVQVVLGGAERIVDNCPSVNPDLLKSIALQVHEDRGVEKAAADVTVVDCLMLSTLVLQDIDVSESCVWQYLNGLNSLSVRGNVITNLQFLANLFQLNTLVLTNTRVADLSPLSSLTNLTNVDIVGNLSVPTDGVLADLTSLKSLSLSGDSLSNACSLQNLTSLTSLKLYDNRLTDISCLAGLTNLVDLDLHHNMLTDITVLTNLPQLRTVDLRYNLLTNLSSSDVFESLTNCGVTVRYEPQRAVPQIHILTNYIVAAGWSNTIAYYIQENGVNAGSEVAVGFDSDRPERLPGTNVGTCVTNTSPDWLEWRLHVMPTAGPRDQIRLSLFATNDVGLVGSSYTFLTVTPPLSISNQLFTATNLTWRTSPRAPWFGQSVVTHGDHPAAQNGSIGNTESSWLEADVVGPGLLTFWWRVSSQTNADMLEFSSAHGIVRISGEVGWQQRSVSVPAGSNTLRWEYAKCDVRYSAGLDAGWVAEVNFCPADWLQLLQTKTNDGISLSWSGPGILQSAPTPNGPWTNNLLPTNSFLIVPPTLGPAQFFRLRLEMP